MDVTVPNKAGDTCGIHAGGKLCFSWLATSVIHFSPII